MKKSYLGFLSFLILVGFGISGCSKPAPHLGESVTAAEKNGVTVIQAESRSLLASGGLAGKEEIVVQVVANVVAVETKTRTLSLKLPNGKVNKVKVPTEARNFPQIKAGDDVVVQYTNSISFEQRKPTAEEIKNSGSFVDVVGRSPKGDMPGAAVAIGGETVVTVKAIDTTKGEITLKDTLGEVVVVAAKYPQNLNYVKVGQPIVISYSESVIASVERVK